MTQHISHRRFIVAYGYQQTFELSEAEAKALVEAREHNVKIVKFTDRVLSTNFTWLVPKEEIEPFEFTADDLYLCEKVAEWLSRDVNDLDWDYEQALSYSKKLLTRVGFSEVSRLWRTIANGAYPSVKRFLSEAKQISDIEEPINTSHMLDED